MGIVFHLDTAKKFWTETEQGWGDGKGKKKWSAEEISPLEPHPATVTLQSSDIQDA